MTKAELVQKLVMASSGPHTGRTMWKSDVEALLCGIDIVVRDALARGESVPLAGGKLEPKKRRARTGRNPRTGDPVEIPACVVVRFTAGKALKEALNGGRP